MNFVEKYLRQARAGNTTKRVRKYLESGEAVLDIGAGDCLVIDSLTKSKKLKAKAVDVIDYRTTDFPLTIYQGKKLPFSDKVFDTSLLLSVLHHTENPVQTLKEAKRTTKKKIIIEEDIFENRTEKIFSENLDWLSNHLLSGVDTPHQNKTKLEWQEIFRDLNLRIEKEVVYKTIPYLLRQVIFVLKVN